MDAEFFAFEADAVLGIKDGAGRGEADADGGIEHQGGEEEQAADGRGDVHDAFYILLPLRHGAGVDIAQNGPEYVAGPDGPGEDIEGIGDDLDADILVAEFFDDGLYLRSGRAFEGDDDEADIIFVDGLFDPGGVAELGEVAGDPVV